MSRDPTKTGAIRRRFRNEAVLRFQRLFQITKRLVVDDDLLGLMAEKNPGFYPMPKLTPAQRLDVLTDWFTRASYQIVVAGGNWLAPHLQAAYISGLVAGSELTKQQVGTHTLDPLHLRKVQNELEGIVDATIQQVLRVSSAGLSERVSPIVMWRSVAAVFGRTAIPRVQMLANTYTVAVHNSGRLAAFRAAHIRKVGIDPEHEHKPLVHRDRQENKSNLVGDAKTGPGSRVPRSRTPSARTIRRIRAATRRLEELGSVNVLTAGDEKVCQQCQDIADDGPYDINTAEDLIPAHPRCRCAFVPTADERFAANREQFEEA